MQALPTKRVVVDDTTYELTKLGAREARRVLARLLHMAEPVIAELGKLPSLVKSSARVLSADSGDSQKAQVTASVTETVVERVLPEFVKAMTADPDTMDEICDVFAKYTGLVVSANQTMPLSNPELFNAHMTPRGVMHQIKWAFACAKWNFADFLDVLSSTSLPSGGATPSVSTSPPK